MKIIYLVIFFSCTSLFSYTQTLEQDAYRKCYNLGLELAMKESYESAIILFDKAIEYKPNDFNSYFLRGTCKSFLPDNNGAIEDLSKSIKLNPNFYKSYLTRALVYIDIQDNNKAIQDLNKVIELDSTIIDAYMQRAKLKISLKDYRGALVDYDRIILLSPNYEDAYYLRGLIKLRFDDKERGCSDLSTACELGNKDACEAFQNNCVTKKNSPDN